MAKKQFSILALVVIASMLLTACGGTSTATPPPATAMPATAMPATAMPATAMPATAMPATAMPATAMPAGETPSAGAMMTGTTTPGGMMAPLTITMHAENGSGEDGTAIITAKGDADVTVSLNIQNAPADAQPAHIHKGTCATLDPKPLYPLTNVVSGKSDSEVMVSMADLEKGTYAINVHKSATDIATYVSCGDISTAMMGGTPGPSMTGTPGAMAATTPIGMATVDPALKGKTVTIFGVAADEQARLFQKEFDDFTAHTGIKVTYEGDKNFETLIRVRVEGNNAPDIATFAQPGLLADFVNKGKIVDLNSFMSKNFLQGQYNQTFLDLATINGKMAGVWHNNDVKSLVWYPKDDFTAKGYKIPTTWDEMLTLSDQIAATGVTPWCIGIESAGATGWVGTDWVEDVVLRTTSPENYDKWVHGTLKFNSPEIKKAFDTVGNIWFNPKYVYGGSQGILTTAFGDSPKGLFTVPPKCYLHRQASFITNFFPKDAVVGKDVDYFYLPPIDAQYGKPVLGSGSLAAMFNDRPEVRAVMEYLATGESIKVEVQAGVAVAPQKDANPSWYPNDAARGFAKILNEATTFRFDGSDQMPAVVGAGTFWTGIVNWVQAEGKNTTDVLNTIDASWPK